MGTITAKRQSLYLSYFVHFSPSGTTLHIFSGEKKMKQSLRSIVNILECSFFQKIFNRKTNSFTNCLYKYTDL